MTFSFAVLVSAFGVFDTMLITRGCRIETAWPRVSRARTTCPRLRLAALEVLSQLLGKARLASLFLRDAPRFIRRHVRYARYHIISPDTGPFRSPLLSGQKKRCQALAPWDLLWQKSAAFRGAAVAQG